VPAIQPSLLRQQAIILADEFEDPPVFVRSLHHMLDYYADRARRPGQSGKPGPLMQAYKVRAPVLRQLLQELIAPAEAAPDQALALCDALWEQPFLEFRLLAARLLGQTAPVHPEPIIQRVTSWLRPDLEDHLVTELLTSSLERLRRENPEEIVQFIQLHLDSSDVFQAQLGLRALIPLINEPDYENLPVFFRLIHPYLRSVPGVLKPDVLDILEALARRSPPETAFFLRQTLEMPSAVDTPWLTRQVLPAFPPDIQKNLRDAVRGKG